MHSPDAAALGNSIDLINAKAKEIRKSVEDFLFILDKEQSLITWPNVLGHFAVLSGHISTLMSAVKSDKTPPLRNFVVLPHRISPDPDPQLQFFTDGRVSIMSHAEVPDYLRTKPDPEVDEVERQLSLEASAHGDPLGSTNQVALFNKHCNKALEKLKVHGPFQKDVSRLGTNTGTLDRRQTQELFATFYYGRGMKTLPISTTITNVTGSIQ